MPQDQSTKPKPKTEGGVVKHRACDECRSRKLACSKESDGCSRCRKEGLKCVYSAQKPMGRPRKRRLIDESEDPEALAQDVTTDTDTTTPQFQIPLQYTDQSSSTPSDAMPGLSSDMSAWLNADYTDFDLQHSSSQLDPYQPFNINNNPMAPATLPLDLMMDPISTGFTDTQAPPGGFQIGGVDLLEGINFDEKDLDDKEASQNINEDFASLLSAHAFQATPFPSSNSTAAPAEARSTAMATSSASGWQHDAPAPHPQEPPIIPPQEPYQDSPPFMQGHDTVGDTSSSSGASASAASPQTPPSRSSSTYGACGYTEGHGHGHKSLPQATCGCLSQIYLSLDSLSRLPEDVSQAMRVARTAAKAAHDVVVCRQCSMPFVDDPTVPVPIQAFQNMMMLGALIPTTVNAYIRILELVEKETTESKEKGETMLFRFNDYGGLWGRMHEVDAMACHTASLYDNRAMEPDQWRLAVRALLKVDIYGFKMDARTSNDGSLVMNHSHPGLKDVINFMEERSNRRHDRIDAMVAAGHPHPMKDPANALLVPPGAKNDHKDERNCLKIVEMARVALDKLVIA